MMDHAMIGLVSAWLVTYLAHSTSLLGIAWVATRVVGYRATPLRDLLWKVAGVGPLLTATAALMLSRRQEYGVSFDQILMLAGREATDAYALPESLPAVAFVTLWLVGASIGLYRVERGRRQYWRQVGRRETLADPATVDTLRRVQTAAGCSRTIYLTTSPGIGAPAAIGRAEICLPADSFAALSPVQREAVLAHELGHLVRRDPRWRFALDLLAAVFTIQPLLRIARRELRDCAEMLCDDFAIQLTGLRRPLVESLALLAGSLRPDAGLVATFGEGASPLIRRAERVLDSRRKPMKPPGRAAGALLSCGLLAGTLALAPSVAAPRALDQPAMVFFPLTPDMPLPADAGSGVQVTVRAREGDEQVTVHRGADGAMHHEYSRDGVVMQPDASTRPWIAEILKQPGWAVRRAR